MPCSASQAYCSVRLWRPGEPLAQAPDGLWTVPDGHAPKLHRTPEN